MLSKWTLSNFKSFKEPTEVKLAPITVLAGANSSGKSTIIQSILLLKQTIEYVPASRAIGLNGPLLKLGRFDDIKNAGGDDSQIKLSWTIDDLSSYRPSGANAPAPFMYAYHRGLSLKQAAFEISFGINEDGDPSELTPSKSTSELRQLHPVLQLVTCAINYSTVEEGSEVPHAATTTLRRSVLKRDTQDLENSTTAYAQAKRSLTFHVDHIDPTSRREVLQERPESRIVGASIRHFFPYQFGVAFNKGKDLARKITNSVISYPHTRQYYFEVDIRKATVPVNWSRALLEIIQSSLLSTDAPSTNLSAPRIQERLDSFPDRDMTLAELLDALQELIRRFDTRSRSLIRNALVENQEILEKKYLELTSLPQEVGFEIAVPEVIHYGVEQAIVFFQHAIRYLGPLRDEPRPIYPLEASVNPTDVGYRGEHTAAVLDLYSDRLVRYIKSADAENLIGAKEHTDTLQRAVTDWLSYLGVAVSVRTTDRGTIGHQLQVRTGDISKDHDLTNVGVGVSQLLPIIVMALLAPCPSLLIFEQPELHLHPKVQARLADFFISLGLIGKQCLLETHSEYLVERLRRRIAEAEGNTLNEKIGIYFTQQIEGRTVCTPVEVTPYGAIKNWPSDFFDQTQYETEHLLRAAQDKLKRERQTSAK